MALINNKKTQEKKKNLTWENKKGKYIVNIVSQPCLKLVGKLKDKSSKKSSLSAIAVRQKLTDVKRIKHLGRLVKM